MGMRRPVGSTASRLLTARSNPRHDRLRWLRAGSQPAEQPKRRPAHSNVCGQLESGPAKIVRLRADTRRSSDRHVPQKQLRLCRGREWPNATCAPRRLSVASARPTRRGIFSLDAVVNDLTVFCSRGRRMSPTSVGLRSSTSSHAPTSRRSATGEARTDLTDVGYRRNTPPASSAILPIDHLQAARQHLHGSVRVVSRRG